MKIKKILSLFIVFKLNFLVIQPLLAHDDPYGHDNLPSTLAPVLKKVTSAVVNISVGTNSRGSGVIVDAGKGFVLTNHHVIAKQGSLIVTLKDNRRFEAEIVGSDPETDVALLRIEADAHELTEIPMRFGEPLEVGDFVVAIGNPFALGQTTTFGIVSALGRDIHLNEYEDFIQVDALINPGNSGGALVDMEGELVGINTAIARPGSRNTGIGFAVPVEVVYEVMRQLEEYGFMNRGQVGLGIHDLTPDLAEALKLDVEQGAVVSRIRPGSPAEKAGFQVGDIIFAVDGKTVEDRNNFKILIGLARVNQEVRIDVQREQKGNIQLKVYVGVSLRRKPLPSVRREVDDGLFTIRGAIVRNLMSSDPYDQTQGVLVIGFESGSSALRYGLRPGDIVIKVNRKQVHNMEELEQALVDQSKVLGLNVLRDGYEVFIAMY